MEKRPLKSVECYLTVLLPFLLDNYEQFYQNIDTWGKQSQTVWTFLNKVLRRILRISFSCSLVFFCFGFFLNLFSLMLSNNLIIWLVDFLFLVFFSPARTISVWKHAKHFSKFLKICGFYFCLNHNTVEIIIEQMRFEIKFGYESFQIPTRRCRAICGIFNNKFAIRSG